MPNILVVYAINLTEGMDEGPILAQAAVPVLAGDDAEKLAARVLKAEHQLYAVALRKFASGQAAEPANGVIISV